ncbi:IS3 family transposase [Streptomyces sp. NPDC048309]|uniref:IS3 family transposase n=1 Tax=Streptomyces sp. NPDC048309 TaxID=3154618 RepID=UPI00340B637D
MCEGWCTTVGALLTPPACPPTAPCSEQAGRTAPGAEALRARFRGRGLLGKGGPRCRSGGLRAAGGTASSAPAPRRTLHSCRGEPCTLAEANLALFEYIDGFYNGRRIQARLGSLSPIEFEERHHTDQASPNKRT